MRNNKLMTHSKINNAVGAVDRNIQRVERQLRKVDPVSTAYTRLESELFQLRQKRSKLSRGFNKG